jgi:VanZ family protein
MRSRQRMIKWTVRTAWFVSIILVVYLSLMPRIEIPYPFMGTDKVGHFLAYAWLAILPFFGFEGMRVSHTGALLMVPLGIGLEFAQQHVPGEGVFRCRYCC